MGFKNYLAENIYVSIENVFYYKNSKLLRFEAVIYLDQTKEHVIASKHYEVRGATRYRRVLGMGKIPPTTPKTGDTWIIQRGAIGDWTDRDNTFAVFDTDHWAFWYIGDQEIFLFNPANKFYTYTSNSLNLAPFHMIEDVEWWDSWFSPNVIFSPNTNIYRQAYLYMKQYPDFEKVVDC